MSSQDNRDKSRKRNYYVDYSKRGHNDKRGDQSRFNATPEISYGHRGFLITALHEFKSYIEMKNILEDYYKAIYENKNEDEPADDKKDDLAEEELSKELDQLRKLRPFKQVKTQCRNTLFINIVKEFDHIDPISIVDKIFSDLEEKRELICPNTFKVIPILDTFRSSASCAKESISALLKTRFTNETGPKKFFIEFQSRGNYKLNPDEKLNIIKGIADEVAAEKPEWSVSREDADFIIIVTALRKVCCLSIVKDYFKRSKYNIVEFCRGPEAAAVDQQDGEVGDTGKNQESPEK